MYQTKVANMDYIKPYEELSANDQDKLLTNERLIIESLHPETMSKGDQLIGDLLVGFGKIKPQDVERILKAQQDKKCAFGEAAKHLDLVSEQDIQHVLAQQFDYPYFQLDSKQFSDELYAAYAPFTEKGEALRDLRSQLLIRWFDQGHKVLALTSIETEDKSNVLAANLAIMFSQLGKKTILVDANLRHPSQHKLFNLDNKLGLSNRLINRATSDDIAQIAHFSNLSLLTAGSIAPNPLELLERLNFSALIYELSSAYDVVLIDTAPFSKGSDAITVAARAQGMLTTVSKDHSRLDNVNLLLRQAKIAGVETVGFVMQEM